MSTVQTHRSATTAVVLTKRYWPDSSDAALRVRHLAGTLLAQGTRVKVITPKWHDSWSATVRVNEVAVERLDHAPVNQLKQSLYRRSIGLWLDVNAKSCDWIWCDEAGLDALTVMVHPVVVSMGTPVVVRFDPADLYAVGNCSPAEWQPSQAVLDSCSRAACVIVPNQSARLLLLRFGVPANKLLLKSDWQTRALDRSSSAIRTARQALAGVNSDLSLRVQDRLVVIPGQLTSDWELQFAIESLAPLLDRFTNLRVWIHGDGRLRDQLYELLQFLGHHRNVAMPGVFSCVESILQAADLVLFPAAAAGHGWLLPTCLLSGIPTLAANSDNLRWHLGALSATMVFSPGDKVELRTRIEQWMKQPDELASAARHAGQLLRRQTSSQGGTLTEQLGIASRRSTSPLPGRA